VQLFTAQKRVQAMLTISLAFSGYKEIRHVLHS
jgi:hypothetical protein